MLFGAKHFLSILTLILKYKGKHLNDVFQILRNYLLFYFNTKLLQKSGIRKNEVIELIYRGFI